MSLKETHEWAKEKMQRWAGLTEVSKGIANLPQEKVKAPEIFEFENPSFRGDVCRRDGDLLFHFFPTTNDRFNVRVTIRGETEWVFGDKFADNLGDAFVEVFKYRERLFWDFVPELNSWVVRCAGYGDNPLIVNLMDQVLVSLKKKNGEDG